jgi:hypothetical protein
MGRLKKHKTEEDLKIARREYSKKYYWKNKEKVDARVKKKYYERKNIGNI